MTLAMLPLKVVLQCRHSYLLLPGFASSTITQSLNMSIADLVAEEALLGPAASFALDILEMDLALWALQNRQF